jgi:hypothetical protein
MAFKSTIKSFLYFVIMRAKNVCRRASFSELGGRQFEQSFKVPLFYPFY